MGATALGTYATGCMFRLSSTNRVHKILNNCIEPAMCGMSLLDATALQGSTITWRVYWLFSVTPHSTSLQEDGCLSSVRMVAL